MNQPKKSEKAPHAPSSLKKGSGKYATHPRVQRAFRSLVNLEKQRANKTSEQTLPDRRVDLLTQEEVDSLRESKRRMFEEVREAREQMERESNTSR